MFGSMRTQAPVLHTQEKGWPNTNNEIDITYQNQCMKQVFSKMNMMPPYRPTIFLYV